MPDSARTDSLLAQIVDTVAAMREEQTVFLAVLTRLAETTETHGEMLADILAAARDEPGPSEVAVALAALAATVRENTAALGGIEAVMAGLPEEIGAAIARATPALSPAPAPAP